VEARGKFVKKGEAVKRKEGGGSDGQVVGGNDSRADEGTVSNGNLVGEVGKDIDMAES